MGGNFEGLVGAFGLGVTLICIGAFIFGGLRGLIREQRRISNLPRVAGSNPAPPRRRYSDNKAGLFSAPLPPAESAIPDWMLTDIERGKRGLPPLHPDERGGTCTDEPAPSGGSYGMIGTGGDLAQGVPNWPPRGFAKPIMTDAEWDAFTNGRMPPLRDEHDHRCDALVYQRGPNGDVMAGERAGTCTDERARRRFHIGDPVTFDLDGNVHAGTVFAVEMLGGVLYLSIEFPKRPWQCNAYAYVPASGCTHLSSSSDAAE